MGVIEHENSKIDEWLDHLIKPEWRRPVPECGSGVDLNFCYVSSDPYIHISGHDWHGTTRILLVCGLFQALVMVTALLWEGFAKLMRRYRKSKSQEYYGYGTIDMIFDVLDVTMSLACCCTFTIRAYVHQQPERDSNAESDEDVAVNIIDFIATGIFGIRYLSEWYRAKGKLKYTLQMGPVLDVLTIVSAICVPLLRNTWLPFTFLRPISMTTALHRLMKVTDLPELTEQLLLSVADFFSMVFTFAGIMFILENLGNPPNWVDAESLNLSFLKSIWFVTVTVSTVGYGDFAPSSILGRVAGMAFIVVGVIFFGSKTSRIAALLQASSEGLGRYSSGNRAHIVITGNLRTDAFRDFVKEYFHPEHFGTRKADYHICVLAKRMIDVDFLRTLGTIPLRKIQVLTGSVLSHTDLERIKLSSAKACFLLTHSTWEDNHQHDREMLLRALAVKKYNPGIEVHVQLLDNASLHLAGDLTAMCVSSLKTGLLAKSAVCPGVIPLLSNLLQSNDSKEINKQRRNIPEEILPNEYFQGLGNEIYKCKTPAQFKDKMFSAVVREVYRYKNKGVLVIALANGSDHEPGRGHPSSSSSPARSKRNLLGARSSRVASFRAPNSSLVLNPGRNHVITEDWIVCIASKDPQKILDKVAVSFHGGKATNPNVMAVPPAPQAEAKPLDEQRTDLPKAHAQLIGNNFGWQSTDDATECRSPNSDQEDRVHPDVCHESVEIAGTDFGSTPEAGTNNAASNATVKGTAFGSSPEPHHANTNGGGITAGFRVQPLPPMTDSAKKHRRKKHKEYPVLLSTSRVTSREDKMTYLTPPMIEDDDKGIRKVDMSGHILVCGKPLSIPDFLGPIMKQHARGKRKVLFLIGEAITDQTLRELYMDAAGRSKVRVYLLQTSPLHPRSLVQACAESAYRVILLCDTTKISQDDDQEPGIVDSEVLFAQRFIAQSPELSKVKRKTVCDLQEDENVDYLNDKPRENPGDESISLQPAFAEGRIYSASMATALLAQSYFNPDLLNLVGALISCRITNTAQTLDHRIDIVQERVPEEYVGKSYAELVDHYVTWKEDIPLGIYRKTGVEGTDSDSRAACTSPSPTTVLIDSDKIFLLANTHES